MGAVHYRGLAVRARYGKSYPVEGWRLRHAWAGLFVLGVASFLALYSAGPIYLDLTSSAGPPLQATQLQSGRIAVAQLFLQILGLLPLAAAASRLDAHPWWSRWTFAKCVLIAALLACLLRVPSLIVWLLRPELVPKLMLDNAQFQMLTGVRDGFGLTAMFWLVTIAAPVTEEFVFRGVLLKAFSAHVAFGWANLLQAAIFAGMHMDLAAFPFLLALGAVAGFVAKRSGGLLAPITLHAVFNGIAGFMLVG
jgi:membrane protease YdiL (CAAX protease family)